MPSVFVPAKSRAHRLACLSLYKALLKQCSNFPLPAVSSSSSSTTRSTLSSIVRLRFRKDRHYKNWQQIRDALQLGRGALQLLQFASEGSSKALKELTAILSSSIQVATQHVKTIDAIRTEHTGVGLPRKYAKMKEREIRLTDKSIYRRHPDTVPVLQRPVPYDQALKHEDGRRKVPHYFVANGIPFLRYAHKQPVALSRYIDWAMKRHKKSYDMREKHDEAISVAELEDEWDDQLRAHYGPQVVGSSDEEGGDASSWTSAHRQARQENSVKAREVDARRYDYGKKLFDVFLKEEQLAKQENEAREAGGKKERTGWFG